MENQMNLKPNPGHLSKTQKAVIEDMLKGLGERKTLIKYGITQARWRKWLRNGLFGREINLRIESAMREGRLEMARRIPKAAQSLTNLTISEKPETARKACLDVISLRKADIADESASKNSTDNQQYQLSYEKAAKIWAVLAEKDQKITEKQPSN
jgi:hypothetical protein